MTSAKPSGSKITPSLRRLLNTKLATDLIVTPPLEKFLIQNPNLVVDSKVARQMARVMSTPQRDRRYSWSASSAGLCPRRQELAFLGVQVPYTIEPQLQQVFNNGTWVHLRWQATLLTAGILDAIEVRVTRPSLTARCSMDGMGTVQQGLYQGEPFGFELKGRNDYAYTQQMSRGVDEKTRRQVDFEFMLSGLELFSIVNENKNNQGWTEWVFTRDRARIRVALDEVKGLNKAIDTMRLDPMLPECRKRDGEFKKCPFGGIGGPCEMSGSWPNLKRK